jgi:hypothetical protein
MARKGKRTTNNGKKSTESQGTTKRRNMFALLDDDSSSSSSSSSQSNNDNVVDTSDSIDNRNKRNTKDTKNTKRDTGNNTKNTKYTPNTRRNRRNTVNTNNDGWSTVNTRRNTRKNRSNNSNTSNYRRSRQNRTGIHYDTKGDYPEAVYDDNNVNDDSSVDGDTKVLNTSWRLWLHKHYVDDERRIDNKDWSVDSYIPGPKIVTVSDMLKLMHDYESLDKNIAQFFLMRNEIKPIWEDVNNKDGLITSIKINTGNRNGGVMIGSIIYKILTILTLNESLVRNNIDINGICYSIKNRSILIKIWVKNRKKNADFQSELPMEVLKAIEAIADTTHSNSSYNGSCVSIMTKHIEPEY